MAKDNSSSSAVEWLSNKLLNHLVSIRSNFAFGLQFWALLKDSKTANQLWIHRVVVKEDGIYAIPPGKSMQIAESESGYILRLGGPKERDFEHAALEFVKLQLRAFVTESFEKLKAHCVTTGRMEQFKAREWYHFARMVRNALAHDQNWHFNKYDKALLPVSWNGKTITLDLNDSEMTWEFFDPYDALELWDAMYEFAETVSI